MLALEGDDDLVLTGEFALSNDQTLGAPSLTAPSMNLGAADNMIRLYKGDKLQKTFRGHTQAVRALAKVDKSAGGGEGGDLFASGSNDGSVALETGLPLCKSIEC